GMEVGGPPFLATLVRGRRDLLADDRSHRAAEKEEVHRADQDREPSHRPGADDDRVGGADGLLALLQAVPVSLRVAELQGIGRAQLRIKLRVLLVVEEKPEPLPGRQAEVEGALRADLEVPRELLVVEAHPDVLALNPEPFRGLALPLAGLLGDAVLLEPHGEVANPSRTPVSPPPRARSGPTGPGRQSPVRAGIRRRRPGGGSRASGPLPAPPAPRLPPP